MRPTKYTVDLTDKILDAIRIGSPFIHAANAVGISYETFNEWRKRYSEFAEAVKKAEGEAVSAWLAKIEQAANAGNWQAAAWKLERRYPQDFGKRDRMPIDVRELDTDLERELALLATRGEATPAGEVESKELVN